MSTNINGGLHSRCDRREVETAGVSEPPATSRISTEWEHRAGSQDAIYGWALPKPASSTSIDHSRLIMPINSMTERHGFCVAQFGTGELLPLCWMNPGNHGKIEVAIKHPPPPPLLPPPLLDGADVTWISNAVRSAESPKLSLTVITIPVSVPTSAEVGVPIMRPSLEPKLDNHAGGFVIVNVNGPAVQTSLAVGWKSYRFPS